MSNRFFASDNSSPVHPAVMDALASANEGHAVSYGSDVWTERATRSLRRVFGRKAEVFFVYNGTGANVLGMQSALQGHHAIVCTDVSHINTDECGAPERYTGAKLLAKPSIDGRLQPESIIETLSALSVEHHSQPRIVSLTQATELGTVYNPVTIKEISSICRKHGLYLHMDGARIANAAVTLDSSLADLTVRSGVDILSLGGTKNGMMFGEAVVVFSRELAKEMKYIRKQGMQLASKMRYISAQVDALFGTELWRDLAQHANGMARLLAERIGTLSDATIVYPVEANAVFVRLPNALIERAQKVKYFYVWESGPEKSVVRLMCSFDTTEEDISTLIETLSSIDR
ncbi:MAG: threonine aldolase family protein [Spirochaetales bacterium]